MKSNEYEEFADAAPSTEGLASVSALATELYEAELAVAHAELALKNAQAKVQDLSERVLPDLMGELGLKEIKLANGTKLSVEAILQMGSVTKDPAVLEWLEKTGHSSKIKRTVSVSLGKDADEQEKALLAELQEEGFADVSSLRWVESQTLKAHVKALMATGGEVDLEMLKARLFSKAKITGKADKSSVFGE